LFINQKALRNDRKNEESKVNINFTTKT
jgi:hypothetical protein